MKLSFFQMLILYCVRKIDGDRTISSIYHLLKGKKSSQTIQDAHLFELTNLFQTIPFLTRSKFLKTIEFLEQATLIKRVNKNTLLLTDNGRIILANVSQKNFIPTYLKGWDYHQLTLPFWERLSLLVQVCSNLLNNENSYIPIQSSNETKIWIKQFLKSVNFKRSELAKKLYSELYELLNKTTEIDARALVIRLTGYNNIGLTNVQAAKKLEMDLIMYTYQFVNVLHYLILESSTNRDRYILLSSLCSDEKLPLTNSTQITYRLLQKGYSINKISKIRKLKKGTIEDHIVEVALIDKNFKIDCYVNSDQEQAIVKAIKKLHTRQLKTIKENVANVNYFQIRLVLAKYGD